MKHLKSVEFLRGGAALLVVLAHANLIIDKALFHGLFVQGWCMVDLFFILSGFLTAWTYKKETSPFTYVKKRFIRIYPTYWIYTLIVITVHFVILELRGSVLISWTDMDAVGITKSMFLIPTNVAVNEMPIIPPAWTLSYEIMFYTVGIVLFAFGNKAYYTVILIWTSGIFLNLIFKVGNLYLSFAFSSLFVEFFAGLLIAEMIQRQKFNFVGSLLSIILGSALLILSWISENFMLFSLNRVIKFGIPLSLILYGLSSFEKSECLNDKKSSVLSFLAKISFSLYLVHYPLIVVLNSIFIKIGIPSLISFSVISSLCILAGYIANAVIERPVTRLLK